MSLIQSIIGTAIYTAGGGGGGWSYPPVGNGYPDPFGGLSTYPDGTIVGYYEAGSLLDTPTLGLYRRTYTGTAFGSDLNDMDPSFPDSYTLVELEADPYVGFATGTDVAEYFTMEWVGYFKPAVSGDFAFGINVDDHAMMWVGETAVSGYTDANALVKGSNAFVACTGKAMVADRYYPVRIRYVENGGNHSCAISTGLINTTLVNNQESAATGQFYFDTNAADGAFPSTGLII